MIERRICSCLSYLGLGDRVSQTPSQLNWGATLRPEILEHLQIVDLHFFEMKRMPALTFGVLNCILEKVNTSIMPFCTSLIMQEYSDNCAIFH